MFLIFFSVVAHCTLEFSEVTPKKIKLSDRGLIVGFIKIRFGDSV